MTQPTSGELTNATPPNACGWLLLNIHQGVTDEWIRRHRRSCHMCQEIRAVLGDTSYDRPVAAAWEAELKRRG